MTEGNVSTSIVLSKTAVLIQRGMGLTLPQLANKYGLSNSQMKLALQDMGIMKADVEEESAELTTRELKFNEVCEKYAVNYDDLTSILAELGLTYKTGKRSTKGGRKFTIINDYQNEA